MAEDAVKLFEEYAVRAARGERPDVREYLDRAGEERDELARMLDRHIVARQARDPDPDTVALFRAWLGGEPTLLELRRRRGLRRADVVSGLLTRLGLEAAKREKVAGYYHELESGLLDVGRVDHRVFEALADVFGAPVRDLLAWPARPVAAAAPPAFYRAEPGSAGAPVPPAAPQPAESDWDEVDELFRGQR